jgi:hypothetical protein
LAIDNTAEQMAHQTAEHDTDSWNPALRPEDSKPTATMTWTEGGLSDLIAADSKDQSLADVISPQSEDFSAWEISDEVDATPAQYTNMDELVNNASTAVDEATSMDGHAVGKGAENLSGAVESIPTVLSSIEPADIVPTPTLPETNPAESEPFQTGSPSSEVQQETTESVPTAQDTVQSIEPQASDPIVSTLASEQAAATESTFVRETTPSTDEQTAELELASAAAQSSDNGQQSPIKEFFPQTVEADADPEDPWATFEQQLSSTLPSTQEAPGNEIHNTVPQPDSSSTQFQNTDEATLVEEAAPAAVEQTAPTDAPFSHESNGDLEATAATASGAEASFVAQGFSLTNDTHPDPSAGQPNTNNDDPLSWANETSGGVESDEDDFYNQLRSQTKPIFAPPEAESRFEEGVPLLDESTPASPEQPVEVKSSIDGVFANNEDTTDSLFGSGATTEAKNEGDDFFGSISKQYTEEAPHTHLARKSTTQVLESAGFGLDSPVSDVSAAVQFDDLLKGVTSVPQTANEPQSLDEHSEEKLAARWEAELGDSPDDDLAARWEAALDDDDILLETEATQPVPAQVPVQQTPTQPTTSALSAGLNSPFQTPQPYSQPKPATGAYTPHQPSTADLLGGLPMSGTAPPATAAMSSYFSQKPVNPVTVRGESFAEQSKQGYKSPYDLPDDISRPRKPLVTHKPVPPPATSMPPPPLPGASSMPPPAPGFSPAAPAAAAAPPPAPKNFYEELPMPQPRSRPASSGRYTPNPQAAPAPTAMAPPPMPPLPHHSYAAVGASGPPPSHNPYEVVASAAPPQPQHQYPPVGASIPPRGPSPYTPAAALAAQPIGLPVPSALSPPEQLDPYASLASSAPAGPPAVSRYSPQPPGSQLLSKPSKYSPQPPASSGGRPRYPSQPLNVPGQNLPFQPRTSSPLAYHEKMSYQPDQSHKPPTLEPAINLSPPRMQGTGYESMTNPYVAQHHNAPLNIARRESAGSPVHASPPQGRYAPQDYINEFAQRLAPTSNYPPASQAANAPLSPPPNDIQMGPLRRSQTQSPGRDMTSPRSSGQTIDTLQRPASVHVSGSPTKTVSPYAPIQVPSQNRAVTQHLEFIAPTDGQEQDPLERWKGAPIFKFGFGGSMVSCFPRHIPRYSVGQVAPMIKPTPGETKISKLNEWLPAADSIVQHPGPLKTKSKKKDLVAWLSSRIAAFENVGVPSFDQVQSDTHKRHDEKTLLWKVVKLLVENDGNLETSPELQQSLRQAIFPNLPSPDADGSYGSNLASNGFASLEVAPQPDTVDSKWLEELRLYLISGDREKAVWGAVDRRLWGHAMLIASTMDKSIGKQVTQEFVRREVRSKGENSASLAALYEIFAGNVEESIDELVPPSARAGLQLVSKADGQGATKNALAGLDKWRDTLGLVLSNRSPEDHQALLALGRLLASYGRTEAAHICFIFSRSAVFGGPDDPQANIVLLGADHQRSPSSLLDEDAIMLTEAYEYATSVLGNSTHANLPHLLSFKILNARCLVDQGRNSEAQAYCDAVASALKATTRPSPYYHQHLFAEVEELCARLRQTTTDSGSWISRPSMEKVSGSMWARFNNFVAGDDSDAASTGSGKGEQGDIGPFANVAGTPTISRSPSVSDIYGSYPGPGSGAQPIPTAAPSKYHPASQYAPNASPEQFKGRSSIDSQRSNPYFPSTGRRSSQELSPSLDGHMSYGGPIYGSPNASGAGYQPTPPSSYVPLAPVEEALSPAEAPAPAQPTLNGLFYQPPGHAAASTESPYYQGPPGMPAGVMASSSPYEPPAANSSYEPVGINSYEPVHTSSYEPVGVSSSYEPYGADTNMNDVPQDGENKQPKKKSMMDDDDDDDLAARAAAMQKAENDRLAKEAFAKAAEEDGMY